MAIDFDAYFRGLAESPLDDKTEHTDRAKLELLLAQAAGEADAKLRVHHEPRRDEGGGGSPDYRIKRDGRIVGYVEAKTIDENLSKVLKSDQIKKYLKLSDNILLTDYLDFVWLKDGEVQRARLAHSDDLTARKLALRPENEKAVATLLRGFFSSAPQEIGRGKVLAVELATRAALLRDFLSEELQRQAKANDKGRLHGLYDIFRQQVFHDLTVGDFADAFAQMLAYGLFLARLNAGANAEVGLDNVRRYIPVSFSLIRELVGFLEAMEEPEYRPAKWIIDEILSIVNGINLIGIQNDLSFRARKAISRQVRAEDEEEHRLFERDPFIYFYEDFLKAYDPAMRKSRGVYYTPPPVVNFIVRAVDDILKDTFEIPDGLADHRKVTVLDFACGTGTFLLEVFERVFDSIGGPQAGKADAIVREHLLKNIYGFEYLMAPYTIAHLKLSQYLRDKEHPLRDDERLQVFLTNTLEPVEPQQNLLLPQLSHEVEAAQAVKEKPILVITGNPPYSGHSKNKGDWIKKAVSDYKYYFEVKSDGTDIRKSLGEKNPKWLNDDYVKFIRFAQLKMDAVDEGIVAIITNHSWLDNPTFRGMRQSLMRSFDQIYVLDLHGSTKPKEPVPTGLINENVFDIQKGVAVTILVKKPGVERGIWFSEFWGSRLEKYKRSADSSMASIKWGKTDFFAPYYMARPLDWTGWEVYSAGWQVADSLSPTGEKHQIFRVHVLGFQSHRDHFALGFERNDLKERVADLTATSLSDAQIKLKYSVKDGDGWSVAAARTALRNADNPMKQVIDCAYRPFDSRVGYFDEIFMDRPRRELLDHVAHKTNVQLLASRQIGGEFWKHAFVADTPPNDCVVSDASSEANYVFPMWTYDGVRQVENLAPAFRLFLDERYGYHYSPEETLGYIYAVLNSPSYRRLYAEFLRIDFPRIPFPDSKSGFEELSKLGWALIQTHLLKVTPRSNPRLGDYSGKGDHVVESVRYSPQETTIWINFNQGFTNIPQSVWDFQIGGYQVLDKYLKSRKGRSLNLDEQTHIGQVAEALSFTIEQMAKIDDAWRSAFPDRG